jgi:uncharacterized protein with HEPN domain
MPRDPSDILREDRIRPTHMVESAQRALRIASGMTASSLAADEVRMLAVVKSIEIIGEPRPKSAHQRSSVAERSIGRAFGRCGIG